MRARPFRALCRVRLTIRARQSGRPEVTGVVRQNRTLVTRPRERCAMAGALDSHPGRQAVSEDRALQRH